MISDSNLFVNKFISVPKDMGGLNCAAFVAGIVKGVLDGAGFPARRAALKCCCNDLKVTRSSSGDIFDCAWVLGAGSQLTLCQ